MYATGSVTNAWEELGKEAVAFLHVQGNLGAMLPALYD
jgi:hypothetical protein